MYRVVKAASENADFEDYLYDLGLDYDANEVQHAVDRFTEVENQCDEDGSDLEEVINDYSYSDFDFEPETGAQITAICAYLGIDTSQVVRFRENSDSDFCAVTLRDGTIEYFFDRGLFSQGLKDSKTGELIRY